MRLQLLSDLHFETEQYDPEPAPGSELLVLAGDIDSRWESLERFSDWPTPVVFVAGNHEFDDRDLDTALPALRRHCADLGITMLERDSLVFDDDRGRRIRLLGTTRWCDFDVFGAAGRAKAMRAGVYFQRLMQARRGDREFDVVALREEGLACRAWLDAELMRGTVGWDKTVVITHFAPSLKSADPRYGTQAATGSFCNADDDLIARADLWLHGHLHCIHDYHLPRSGGGRSRVVCNARGHERRGEAALHNPRLVLEV
jgi:hypothetical protein